MGKRSESAPALTAPPTNQLHPRPRQVTFWLPATELDGQPGVRPWVLTTEADTYLVMSPEVALQCEVAGVPYTLINPTHALAVDVQDHVPGTPVQLPTGASVTEPANGQVLQDEHLRAGTG